MLIKRIEIQRVENGEWEEAILIQEKPDTIAVILDKDYKVIGRDESNILQIWDFRTNLKKRLEIVVDM